MDFLLLSVFLFSCRIEVGGAQVELTPLSLTVVRGGEARFSCSTSSSVWTVMSWLLNGRGVLTISKNQGVIPSVFSNITAEKCSNAKTDCWVLVLNSTQRSNQGQVTCDLQQIDSKTANLFVQEKGTVRISGGSRMALKGDSVLFLCQAAGWFPLPDLQWEVHNKKVSLDEYNISSTEVGRSLFTVSSHLVVTAERSSAVDCLASVSSLSTPLRASVNLTVVAEVFDEKREDCTVLVGLTAALSALLLLVLLSFFAALCYRRRRKLKKTPQEGTRSDQSLFGSSLVAEATGGKVNLGFSSDGPTAPTLPAPWVIHNNPHRNKDVHSSEVVIGTPNQMSFSTFQTVPDVVRSSSVSLHTESQTTEFQEDETDIIRRITTV